MIKLGAKLLKLGENDQIRGGMIISLIYLTHYSHLGDIFPVPYTRHLSRSLFYVNFKPNYKIL
jgi:hypothetical protein